MRHAIIMAGGSGTRFWPKSRRNKPKQLLRLTGSRTMLQQTLDRIRPLAAPEQTWIITGEDQAAATREQAPELPVTHVVGEPCPRDTAACVGLAAHLVARDDPDGSMVVMPADHVIQPATVFQQALNRAFEVVEADPSAFVTFGVRPTRPETGYGYIEMGALESEASGSRIFKVTRFREKPSREVAEEFLATGRFVWNAGIFVWKARAILDAIEEFQPELAAGLNRVAAKIGSERQTQALAHEYPGLPKLPIDKAVMEFARNVKVLEVEFDWNDVGDWRSLATLLPQDQAGNHVDGPVHLVDTRHCIVIADEGRLIATLGVEDLVIVQSGGATLVARRENLDQLKAMVEGLGNAGFPAVL